MNTSTTSAWSIFLIFLKLGLTSFGGPIAHLGYFREEFVNRRQWLNEQAYADWVALCQFLPGPASSQVGIALGFLRGGYIGALMAWLGFTLPSAVFLIACAFGLMTYADTIPTGLLHGFKVVAVAIVAQAVWGMASKLCRTVPTVSIMLISACVVLWFDTILAQLMVMITMAILGAIWLRPVQTIPSDRQIISSISKRAGLFWLGLFFGLLIGLPTLATALPHKIFAVVDAFYRSGALVFGGGHVVLPLLQAQTVTTGWISNEVFISGYGLAQIIPGPLFTFSAFLGANITDIGGVWLGGLIALIAIFIPSFLLVFGTMPFWESLRQNQGMQGALITVNAAVVGILLAALYQPVWTSAIFDVKDLGLALAAFVALVFCRLPPWFVVLATGLLAWLMTFF